VSVPGLDNPAITGGMTGFMPLLDLYGREAAAHVQASRLKAVAVV
jgi:hypothetical protein